MNLFMKSFFSLVLIAAVPFRASAANYVGDALNYIDSVLGTAYDYATWYSSGLDDVTLANKIEAGDATVLNYLQAHPVEFDKQKALFAFLSRKDNRSFRFLAKTFNLNLNALVNEKRYNALHYAVFILANDYKNNINSEKWFTDFITLFQEYGGDLQAVDHNGNTALHLAIAWHQYGGAMKILQASKNFDVNRQNGFGNTPLHVLAYTYHRIKDLEDRTPADWDPLMARYFPRYLEEVKLKALELAQFMIINRRAALDLENALGKTARDISISLGNQRLSMVLQGKSAMLRIAAGIQGATRKVFSNKRESLDLTQVY